MAEDHEEVYEFHLLTAERWDDFEKLFGRKRVVMRYDLKGKNE